jgi:undecaprenyl-diphosphatase
VDVIETLDQGTRDWVLTNQPQGLHPVMEAVTFLGDRNLLGVLVAVLFLGVLLAWLVWRSRYPWPVWRDLFRCAALVVVVAVVSYGLVQGIKRVVGRPRPPALGANTSQSTTFSFPSGHAFTSTAVYGTLALLLVPRLRRPWQQRVVAYTALVLILLIGFSRLSLNEHYLTDVLGGWAGGLGCALVCSWIDQWWSAPAKQPTAVVPAEPAG